MFKKRPILKYESALEIYPKIISPAKNHVPEWYKKIPKWKNNEIISINNTSNHTVKQCVPFLDSLTTGYMILLPYDIYVKNNNGAPFITWKEGIKYPPKWREDVSDKNIVPFEHYPMEYTWQTAVAFSVPSGFSLLLTHPLNRHDLPFTTLSGIIDGGLVISHIGNIPFYIKKGFEGIIYQGTPIAQIIPFRQENWFSKIAKNLIKIGKLHNDSGMSVFSGWYKKTFWTKKNYL